MLMLARKMPDEPVCDWAARNIIFAEPGASGPFSLLHRRYLQEPLELWKGPQCSDLVICWATRAGKTRILLTGAAWRILHHPMRCLWTKPATQGPGGARNDARTKWLPMLMASPAFADVLPRHKIRELLSSQQQIINGSIIDWVGTGSAKQLASNPCDVTIQDELDGYVSKGEAEAHPASLIDERTKDCPLPFRVKTSTPTTEQGQIWQWLMRSDLRRRFVPCPLCNPMADDKERFFIIGFLEDMTILPTIGEDKKPLPIAWMRWEGMDKALTEPDAEDLEIAAQSAHIVCPFCKGKITDEHRVWMDEHGEWRPTKKGAPGVIGYHLPSLYVPHRETEWGKLVIKYLTSRSDPKILHNFVNADLAEPWVSQDAGRSRIELSSATSSIAPDGEGWVRLMTVDVQQAWPYFWFVIRRWSKLQANRGDSVLIAQGHADTWDELDAVRQKHDVPNAAVMVDAGFGAYEFAEVYRECAQRATQWGWLNPVTKKILKTPVPGARATPIDGWIAAKGFPSRKKWRHKDGTVHPWRWQDNDPFRGTEKAGQYIDRLFEFAADYFLDVLHVMRSGRSLEQWQVPADLITQDYRRHMDAKVLDSTGRWIKRSKMWPDHLLDCEIMQVAFAHMLGLLRSSRKTAKTEEPAQISH